MIDKRNREHEKYLNREVGCMCLCFWAIVITCYITVFILGLNQDDLPEPVLPR